MLLHCAIVVMEIKHISWFIISIISLMIVSTLVQWSLLCYIKKL